MNITNIITTIRSDLTHVRHSYAPWFHESNEVLHYQPANNGWTYLEILEHVTLTSHFLLLIIDKAAAKAKQRSLTMPIDINWDDYELIPTGLADVGVHRSFTWVRPDHMEPTGNVLLHDIESTMNDQFDRCNAVLDLLNNGEGVFCKTTMSVNGIGKMDVYQYVYFLGLHAKRHLTQLRVVADESSKSDINN